MKGPPRGVSGPKLWRLLTTTPRPFLAFEAPELGPRARFVARALLPREEAEAIDAIEGDHVGERAMLELMVRSLAHASAPSEPLFASVDHVAGSLGSSRCDTLLAHWWHAYHAVAPSLRLSTESAWMHELVAHVHHPAVVSIALALAYSVDGSVRHGVPRPDRYYGLPLNHLTDGHWMAFWAARKGLVDQRNEQPPPSPAARRVPRRRAR